MQAQPWRDGRWAAGEGGARLVGDNVLGALAEQLRSHHLSRRHAIGHSMAGTCRHAALAALAPQLTAPGISTAHQYAGVQHAGSMSV